MPSIPGEEPALTGEWEAQLERIRRGAVGLPDFMKRIEAFVSDLVGKTLTTSTPVQRKGDRRTEPRKDTAPRSGLRSKRALRHHDGHTGHDATEAAGQSR